MAGKADIEAGKAFVRLYVKSSDLMNGLKGAKNAVSQWGKSIMIAGGAISGIGAAINSGIIFAAKSFASTGDEIAKMSERTGIGTNALSELGYAAGQSGASLETVEKSVRKMQQKIDEFRQGGNGAADTMARLGITLDNLAEPPDAQLELFADRLAAIQDPGERAALAMEIFGKAGTEMLPLFADGAEGIRALRQEAVELGQSINPEDAQAAVELGDAWDRIQKGIAGAIFRIGAAVAGPLTDLLTFTKGIVVAVSNWINENRKLFVGILAVGTGLVTLGTILTAAGIALTMLATPIGMVTLGVGAAAAAFVTLTAAGASLAETLTSTWSGIVDAIKAGDMELAGRIAIAGLQVALLDGVAAISTSVGGAFGEFLGSLGELLAAGDFSGAWNLMIQGMAATWDSFAAGVVSVFTDVANAVIGVWEKITSTIAGWILKVQSWLGMVDFENLPEAEKIAAQQVGSVASGMKGGINSLNSAVGENARQSAGALAQGTKGGAAGTMTAADAAREELRKLTAEASSSAEARRAAELAKANREKFGGTAEGAGAASSAVTFSGSALSALGAASPTQLLIDESKRQTELAAQQLVAQTAQTMAINSFVSAMMHG